MRRADTHHGGRRGGAFVLILIALSLAAVAASVAGEKAAELPPGSAALMQPEDLVKTLRAESTKPTILYVGPRFMYAQAHIPGAEYIGPAADPQSMDKLRKRTASLAKNSDIVVYCGCCPWEHCPNIRPAYKQLQQAGFKNVKVLYLGDSLGKNWVEKGYPTEKGEPR
jgi:thiosulfate/3-mercaptopyruvate sulfurtransferase